MRRYLCLLALMASLAPPASAADCKNPATALGVSRVVEIDTSAGPIFGDMTKRAKEPSFLEPNEIVLTFDDGPVPAITGPILDALDAACTKATFFSVGEMAIEYPGTAQDIVARGHTLGTHTYTHPLNLRRLSLEKATAEIERGYAAVTLAAGGPIAPFFRFPGLSDSDELLALLQKRAIASFTVDVISNDSYIGSPTSIASRVLKLAEARKGGILLFHDIKKSTAKALPSILADLKAKGFKVVHLVPKAPGTPLADFDDDLKAKLAKALPQNAKRPAEVSPIPVLTPEGSEPPRVALAPAPRDRAPPPPPVATDSGAPKDGIAKSEHTRTPATHRRARRANHRSSG